jgi:hypothetical protein
VGELPDVPEPLQLCWPACVEVLVMSSRAMTPRLSAALDALTEAQRRQLKAIASASNFPWLRGLLEALVAEVVVAEMTELTVLHDFELDRQADVDKAAQGAVLPEPEDRSQGPEWWPEGK